MTGTGLLGLGAGTAGVALTLIEAWRSSMGTQRSVTAGNFVNPSTMAIGGGAVLLTVGEKTAESNVALRSGLRGAGVALVLGGLAGAIVGAMRTVDGTLGEHSGLSGSTQRQAPESFDTTLPPAPANLEGVSIASADVVTTDRDLAQVQVYVDPTHAQQLPAGTTLTEAIGQARAVAQADELDRSEAVVKTDDGRLWMLRLSGDLDQIDGRFFTKDTKYDSRYAPQISRRQEALQAIVGVENRYVFPAGTGPTDAIQDVGTVPWVTPDLPTASPSTGASTSATTSGDD